MTGAAVRMDLHPQPPAGQPRPWAFPVPERATLASGLTVLRCHRPGRQVAAVEICVDAPLEAEPDGLDGVATIMARALSQGTGRHTAQEFAAELEGCGATLRTQADYTGGRLSLRVPVSRLPRALELLTEALTEPAFPAGEVERLVRNRLDAIPHELANPAVRAARQFARELFPASARMSRPRAGTAESVARIGPEAVREFYAATLRAATATAVIVGDLSGPDLAGTGLDELLAGTLGIWSGAASPPNAVPDITPTGTSRVVIVDRPEAVQTQLLIGRVGPDRHDPAWPALVLGTYCLGGTLTSRLDRVLREEKGYTYGVRASAQVLRSAPPGAADARGASLLAISGSVDTASTGPALADLHAVLQTLAAGGLTDAERDQAVQNLVLVAPLRFETAGPVADTLADQVQQHLPDDFQARVYERLAATTTDEATAAVVTAFGQDSLTTVLVGNADQIAAPVQALGLGAVEVVAAED